MAKEGRVVGDRQKREFAQVIREAAEKAGTVVSAAFAIAGAALLLALAVLVLALRTRKVVI